MGVEVTYFVAAKLIEVRKVTGKDRIDKFSTVNEIKSVLNKEGYVTFDFEDAEARFKMMKDLLKIKGIVKMANATIVTDFTGKDLAGVR